ncbi:alanine and proline-rich secreted protein Apa [Mycobacterium xenopi]|uniref:Alanine and proline-rich secreted protein Apa n=1 Tax=Mycobacterium xenopi TaxID=1789 RepID=A0AAD1M1S7_MYCXE|nr:alanine and proline-rich secreted protein Apa [Mycobacterium xenopi]MDA3640176.1 alanine and proline-rich secreted protein Apa [Mycobacterium xenopi]MDA3658511.1 alanine and proline-rich secreted protein Apa [Mycobacterium xenopi]MDA3662464.1 alanine and proline-rich secreted protein Apa [Mycobacterium xenopi]ORX19495.1 hypothetical protein AWC32_10410 [Mycobacterium xenopi]SPX92741.1 alanine and proline-rich secreted protein apa [Mycobacterium xenopi]
MKQGDPNQTRHRGVAAALAIAALTGAGAITVAVPAATANADPPPAPPSTNAPAPPPADPAAAPSATDPNAAPAADPNAAEAGRVNNVAGGFSYVIPAGWVESDASHLDYGSALLSKETGQPPSPGQPPPVANDTRIVLGRLDQKLYASAEPDNAKAATRLGSDMGEFFMPYPGTRINQESTPLSGNGVSGSASYYEVKFSDTSKPNGQIWTGVVGPSASGNRQGAQQNQQNQRWFVVWLGTANNPVDKTAAKVLAESIRPWTPPPAPAAPAPAAPAPAAPAPAAPAAPGAPPPNAPAQPNQAPAGTPAGAPAPAASLST